MFSSPYPEENGSSPEEVITLVDEAGRSLDCYVEHSLEIEGQSYLILLPVDSPIEIVAWEEAEEEDTAEAVLVDDEEEINAIFPSAQAVLAEQNLALKHTAFSLTVAGELPEATEEDNLILEIEDEEGSRVTEEFQLLATFYHEEQEYSVYTLVEPLLLFARTNESGQVELLSPDEFQDIQPQLKNQLFDDV